MEDELRNEIQMAFANCYEYKEVAILYHEIVAECEKQVNAMCDAIAKERAEHLEEEEA